MSGLARRGSAACGPSQRRRSSASMPMVPTRRPSRPARATRLRSPSIRRPANWRAYVLADNQLAITGSGWDPELLRLELGELKLSGFDLSLTGFGDLELAGIMAERTAGLTDPDDAPVVPEHPVSVPGDLWIMGRHRLLCGDSTVATDVE